MYEINTARLFDGPDAMDEWACEVLGIEDSAVRSEVLDALWGVEVRATGNRDVAVDVRDEIHAVAPDVGVAGWVEVPSRFLAGF